MPAPGTHYYVVGDSVVLGVIPNAGYYIYEVQMTMTHPVYGSYSEVLHADEIAEEYPDGILLDTLEIDDEEMYGMVYSFHVIFMPDGVTPDSYNVTVNYDATMGTVTGAGTYTEGSNALLTATPNTGYVFVAWVENNDTVSRERSYTITNINADHVLYAIFKDAGTGIDDVDMDDVTVYSTDNVIVVRGAEGKQVLLFDVNGRLLGSDLRAADRVEFRVNNSGVYLVKVNDAAAKRVVVIR